MPALARNALPWLRIDTARIYALGSSMGGHETLMLVARHPDLLAGAVAMDSVTDLARRYGQPPDTACDSACVKRWGKPYGLVLQAAMRKEVGGSPVTAPKAYAMRSPLSNARAIASSGVPLQLWWSRTDRIVSDQEHQSGEFFRVLKRLAPCASVSAYEQLGALEGNEGERPSPDRTRRPACSAAPTLGSRIPFVVKGRRPVPNFVNRRWVLIAGVACALAMVASPGAGATDANTRVTAACPSDRPNSAHDRRSCAPFAPRKTSGATVGGAERADLPTRAALPRPPADRQGRQGASLTSSGIHYVPFSGPVGSDGAPEHGAPRRRRQPGPLTTKLRPFVDGVGGIRRPRGVRLLPRPAHNVAPGRRLPPDPGDRLHRRPRRALPAGVLRDPYPADQLAREPGRSDRGRQGLRSGSDPSLHLVRVGTYSRRPDARQGRRRVPRVQPRRRRGWGNGDVSRCAGDGADGLHRLPQRTRGSWSHGARSCDEQRSQGRTQPALGAATDQTSTDSRCRRTSSWTPIGAF